MTFLDPRPNDTDPVARAKRAALGDHQAETDDEFRELIRDTLANRAAIIKLLEKLFEASGEILSGPSGAITGTPDAEALHALRLAYKNAHEFLENPPALLRTQAD